MEKSAKKRGKKARQDRKSRTNAIIIRKAKKKQHINNAALILARWLN